MGMGAKGLEEKGISWNRKKIALIGREENLWDRKNRAFLRLDEKNHSHELEKKLFE